MYSFIYNLEREMCKEKKKKWKRIMCVKPRNPGQEKSAIVGMSVELLNVIDWLVMFKLK